MATSRSPSDFGGSAIGTRINDAIPPALCKSLGLIGSESFPETTAVVVDTLRAKPDADTVREGEVEKCQFVRCI